MAKVLKTIGKVLSVTLCVVLLLVVILNVYIIFARTVFKKDYPMVFGYSNAVVISGSMEPTFEYGDIIVVHRQKDYAVDDIISFKDDIGVVTHRIVEVTTSGYITWGDNRETNTIDDEITRDKVYGKVVMIIPKLGLVVLFFKTTEGIISLTLIIITILVLAVVFEKIKKEKSKKSIKPDTVDLENKEKLENNEMSGEKQNDNSEKSKTSDSLEKQTGENTDKSIKDKNS